MIKMNRPSFTPTLEDGVYSLLGDLFYYNPFIHDGLDYIQRCHEL